MQCFDSFGVEHMQNEIQKFTGHRNIKINILKIQAQDSMCGYFYIRFIKFTLDFDGR